MENIQTLLAAVAQTQGFDDDEPCESTSPPLGLQNSASSPEIRVGPGGIQMTASTLEVPETNLPPRMAVPAIGAGEKRKRGRPAKGHMVAKPPPEKRKKQQEDEEEDVCFICFDGGSLVLCDRKGCPKAYHPPCIKRDEEFFQTNAKWFCVDQYIDIYQLLEVLSACQPYVLMVLLLSGWHICSVKVDFDDKTSWEYLFKMYWVYLKDKLSLTVSELTQAAACKPQSSNVHPSAFEVCLSNWSSEHLELNKSHRESSFPQNDRFRGEALVIDNHMDTLNGVMEPDVPSYKNAVKPGMDEVTAEPSIEKGTDEPGIEKDSDKPRIENDADNPSIVKDTEMPCICKSGDEPRDKDPDMIINNTEWASKDLLEFVAHMKNGDISALSQFDLRTLLLDYTERNNLWDPQRKSQIICDQRLKNLFGKAHVCQIDMLKLLEFHFLKKEDPQKNSFIPAGFVGSSASDMELDGNYYGSSIPIKSRKLKTHKKSEGKAPQNNIIEYAAIDFHNINLIYLRRDLMENLIEDKANFNDKVVGSIVRIKISCNDQKPDFHRLVQVVGTSKVAVPYKIGDKTADIMLEVFNLYKKEAISIDAISDQEFTEVEMNILSEKIRSASFTRVKKMNADDYVKASDAGSWNSLLLEYLHKLEVLKSPEERQRRISKVPEIHVDPKMSPDYDSVEDDRSDDNSKKGAYMRSSCSGFARNEMKSNSPDKKGKEEASSEDASGIHRSKERMNINSEMDGGNDEAMERSVLETSTGTAAAPMENSPSADSIETEKLWHYRDPNGKIQGPFSMTELRTWSTTGLFPPDMRIWTNHEQYDSLLLTDALNGQFHGASEWPRNPSSDSQEQGATGESEGSEDINGTGRDSKPAEAVGCDHVSDLSGRNAGNESGSSSWPKCWDLLKDDNSGADNVQEHSVLPSSIEETHAAPTDRDQERVEVNHGSQNGEKSSSGPTQNQMTSEHELQNQPNNPGQILLSYEEILRSLSVDLSSDEMESEPVYSPVSNSEDANKQDKDIDVPMQSSGFLELLSPAPRSNTEDKGGSQEIEKKQSGLIDFPEVADEWCRYSPSPAKPQVQEWDSQRPPEVTSENVNTSTSNNINQLTDASTIPNWLAMINEPIEFDALGEDSVSDLLAEVAAMESQGGFPSPNSAMKFAKELIQDSKDDCFSSIDEFSSTGEVELTSQSSVPYKSNTATPVGAHGSFTKSVLHSSASSEGETNHAPANSGEAGSEYHPPAPNNMTGATMGPGSGLEAMDHPGWGTVQGNINLVTVQGNVNLVLGGPGQGMENLGWGTNPSTPWVNPHSVNGSLPWDGQRKYGGERFTSPRERTYQGGGDTGFGRGRPPWGRQQYGGSGGGGGGGGGGYSRPLPKGQRVCKFYETGRCRKGAFCDYLHPS
ncbi:hypothetical protein RD792_001384 [Penstemon davidsonii]|uniref:Zinc finger CCCH domain-containing protein 44 n=1 Tax=Penstemon davidsonii TaxID=160366 RepID=A0ABR0DN78_9LAMI|nr:hypothetical protein RD792_001384 [Penstemon davidsonii]